ncbi:MAG: hypothetical protein IPG74_02230 [Flavobacteriales bacterium]|nr:hypothetical protein [Flavobacteriales bacterium]MBK7553023.1 hypothetical protein [Flavobacteriales bacterium]
MKSGKGLTEPAISFPVLTVVDGYYDYYPTMDSYTRGRKADVEAITRIEERVITCDAQLFNRGGVTYLADSNPFFGFNIAFGLRYGFLRKEMTFVKELTLDEIFEHGLRIFEQNGREYASAGVNGAALKDDLLRCAQRSNAIRLAFLLADPSRPPL